MEQTNRKQEYIMPESIYLRSIRLASAVQEIGFIEHLLETCYNTVYPFKIFPEKELESVEFEPITIFYGGNGSGKTTLLNIIAETLRLSRQSAFNSSPLFSEYVKLCRTDVRRLPRSSRILTSDDVSDYLLSARTVNDGIDFRRGELFDEYKERTDVDRVNQLSSLADYDEWLETYKARHQSKSAFVRERLRRNIDMQSNGETAMKYYTEHITEDALYLIDEPENSLSAKFQIELREYLLASARFYGCQFVIATHSPIILSLPGAKIYDLDDYPVSVKDWTHLENVLTYYRFFREHEEELSEADLEDSEV